MKLGYVQTELGRDFAIQEDPDAGWVLLRELGIDARDTGAAIEALRGVRHAHVPRVRNVSLLCPLRGPSKIVATGLNYSDHAAETGQVAPTFPRVFGKFVNALSGPFDPIPLDPRLTMQLDYEIELAVVIGSRLRDVESRDALDGVFGYAVANDVTARDWQTRDGAPTRAKGFDGFCPAGPWITTAEEVPDPQRLRVVTRVNGEVRQDESTAQMIHGVRELISFISQGTTLEPGDVILTGTPVGVGHGQTPPRYLAVGDVVSCEIETLGSIENTVVAASSPADPLRLHRRD